MATDRTAVYSVVTIHAEGIFLAMPKEIPMLTRRRFTLPILSFAATGLAGCGAGSIVGLSDGGPSRRSLTARTLERANYASLYVEYPGERFRVPAVDSRKIDPGYLRQTVEFSGSEAPGSIIVDPASYHLYLAIISLTHT